MSQRFLVLVQDGVTITDQHVCSLEDVLSFIHNFAEDHRYVSVYLLSDPIFTMQNFE